MFLTKPKDRKRERDTHTHEKKNHRKYTHYIDTNVDRHRSSRYSIWKSMIRYEIQNKKKLLQEVCCCSAIIIKFIMFEAFIVRHVCVCVQFFFRLISVIYLFVFVFIYGFTFNIHQVVIHLVYSTTAYQQHKQMVVGAPASALILIHARTHSRTTYIFLFFFVVVAVALLWRRYNRIINLIYLNLGHKTSAKMNWHASIHDLIKQNVYE